ncbi:MAG: DUF3080 family protein [Congregibacter sp.]
MSKAAGFTGLALVACLLNACGSSGPEARLNDYLARLARPLEQSAAEPDSPALSAPPRAETLRLPIEGDSLDSMDFLRLRGCALQATVARRNSSLGRVAPPSQRLLLELAFLREAPACIETLRGEGRLTLAALIADAALVKKEQLPALIFNATLGNLEYREFWRERSKLVNYPDETSSVVVTALEDITADAQRWLNGNYAANEQSFELALSAIARGDGGALRAALRIQARILALADRMIAQRLSRGAVCENGSRPDAAPILRTVAQKYFVGSVQIWSAALNQRYHQLLPALLALETLLEPSFPPNYLRWRTARQTEIEHDLKAPALHVHSLQQLLGSCYVEFAPAVATAPEGPANRISLHTHQTKYGRETP